MSEARRIVITHIHEKDAYYPDKGQLIGSTGNFKPEPYCYNLKGYFAGSFTPDKGSKAIGLNSDKALTLFAIRYKRI